MVDRLRIGILAVVLGFLVWHFSMVWLFINPFQAEKDRSFWGQWYCNPFFSQGWTMFVPVPENNYLIFVDYTLNGKKRSAEVFQSLIGKHRSNRLAGYEPTVVAFDNSIHFFEYNTTLQERLNGPIREDLYFKILKHTAVKYLSLECKCNPENPRLTLVIKPTGGKGMRVYYD
jgi:hypothetical protein